MKGHRLLAFVAIGFVFAGCKPTEPLRATTAARSPAVSSSASPARPKKAPSIALIDTIDSAFATAVPPTVISSGDRIHLFAYGAGTPPALRYAAIGANDGVPARSSVLPAKTIVAATACERNVIAIIRTGVDHFIVSIDESGAIASTHPLALPDRPWAGFRLACVSDRSWILGMTTDVNSSVLWTAPVKDGQLGAAKETAWEERSSGLSATVLGGDVIVLRSHGDHGGATLLRLREGEVVHSGRLSDSVSGAMVTRLGAQLAVAWTAYEAGRQSVRLRLYDEAFQPSGPAQDLANVVEPERLGRLFLMPGPRSLLAVSYFTNQLTDDMIELPNGRSEPAERSAQYLVVFDSQDGTKSDTLRMSMTSSLDGGGWAGMDLLFVVNRFSSVVARYRVR